MRLAGSDPFGLGIDPFDPPHRVDHHQAIRRGFDRLAEEFLAFAQRKAVPMAPRLDRTQAFSGHLQPPRPPFGADWRAAVRNDRCCQDFQTQRGARHPAGRPGARVTRRVETWTERPAQLTVGEINPLPKGVCAKTSPGVRRELEPGLRYFLL